jgi:hypothetical protein
LFLKVEDDDASSIATTDDYIGLELEVQLEKRAVRKRRRVLLLIVVALMIVVVGVVYSKSGNNSEASKASNTITQPNNPSVTQPNNPPVPQPTGDGADTTVDQDTQIELWPTAAPLPAFTRCAPPVVSKKNGHAVFHMFDVIIIPESPTKDDNEALWDYSFSSMDINEEASLIAIGMSDFSADTDYEVGLVRAFAYDCSKKQWKQLGQDLMGTNLYDQFGHRVSSSRDGTVMAIAAPQDQSEGGNGFVQVYYLNDTRWDELGSRIEDLTTTSGYSLLGHAVDLSDKGKTLAVLAVVESNSFIIRVFEYDFHNKKDWVRKGHDLKIQVGFADGQDFDPQISLSEEGDELTMADPKIGVIVYQYVFERDKWTQSDTKQPTWEEDDYWIDSIDTDETGDLVAFSAFSYSGTGDTNITNMAKIVDFSEKKPIEVYVKSFEDFDVNVAVAVSLDGQVAAILGSRDDYDDDTTSYGDEQYIGAMTIIAKAGGTNGSWSVVGKGTKAENIGVPGFFVSLSGNGKIAAVGSDTVVAFYGIDLAHSTSNAHQADNSSQAITNTTLPPKTNTTFDICAPFSSAMVGHAGDLDKLPKQPKEHTLSIAMSEDGSIVAVGIDQYQGENRGMTRVFGWDCAAQAYSQLGQDLFGSDDYDGFGQSVDLSSDGKLLVVGANQPPPGKSGYVEVYALSGAGDWEIVGHRLDNVKDIIEDVGREVRISSDGSTVMFSGSIIEKDDEGWHDTASFVRVMENVDGQWVSKGDDLLASVSYDEYGAEVHISLSGDGKVLGITGSYSTFMAKVYTFDDTKQNWTELVIPPLQGSDDDSEYDWDYEYENYFSGSDIALNDNGTFLAIAGSKYTDDDYFAVVRVLTKDADTGNYTLSHDPVDYDDDYASSAVGLSGDGRELAVGINGHSDSADDQGALFVAVADHNDLGWSPLGQVNGRNEKDLLGARVSMSRDGTLAAASSRKGYVSFFKIGKGV